MSGDVKALINHYAREGFYRHIQTVCDEVIKKRGNEPTLLFWKAFGVAMEGGYTEAIRIIESVRSKRDVELAVAMALLHYHNQSELPDLGEVGSLEATIPTAEDRASESALLLAAAFAWHVRQTDRARSLLRKVLSSNSENAPALALLGWVDLTSSADTTNEAVTNSIDKFERALGAGGSGPRKELEALTGAARYWEMKGEFPKAMEMLDLVTVMYSWYLPALSQKADIMTQMNEWDRAREFTNQVLSSDEFDIKALQLTVLYVLTRQSKPTEAARQLGVLIDSLDRHEPKNASLYYSIARPFARLSSRKIEVLRLTLQLVERAQALNPMSSEYATELAYQHQLMGNFAKAQEGYREAAKLDESNVEALHGMIYCQLAEGQLEDAEQQLEFLNVIHESIGRTAEVAFLEGLLAWRKYSDEDKHVSLMEETKKRHFASLKSAQSSSSASSTYDFYVRFNPDFMMEVCKEYMLHVGSEPAGSSEAPSTALVRARQLLQKLVKVVPGALQAQAMLAQVRYLTHDFEEAGRTIQQCLRLDPTYSEAHLLMAQIGLHDENYRMAMNSLEQALSHDFTVRESPVYHLVKARVLEAMGEMDEAVSVLEAAMSLPGVRSETGGAKGSGGAAGGAGGASAASGARRTISLHDRASIFVKLAEIHTKLNHIPEATKAVQDAMHEFAGTAEEVRVIVANSEIALKRGDADTAVRLLSNVPSSSPAYTKAQMVKADIYLKHRRDKTKYIKCFRDMVTRDPSERAWVLLGEAYMNIQAPEDAIEAFEEALKLNRDDAALASKIGKALVSTHDYLRAVAYYERALRSSPGNISLRSDLTELYCKLQNFEAAGRLLDVALAEADAEDVSSLMHTVNNLVLMAKVHKGNGDVEAAIEQLNRGLAQQRTLMSRLRSESPESVREQRGRMAEICYDLAKLYEEARNDREATAFYHEALKAHASHEPSMLALARLYLRKNELEACQRQCVTLMRVDPNNEDASMMLADLMFRKNESDAAMYHYQQLLEKKRTHYQALSKLITLLRRAGKLEDAPRFLRLAERSSPRAQHEPGFRFCKGLLFRAQNNPHEAIREFNAVRQSGEWGDAATEHMVEIYLAPDNESLWEDGEAKDAEEGIRIAEKLLRELPNTPLTKKQKVLQAYTLMATKNKASMDAALGRLEEILSADRDYVPALLAMSTLLMIQGQTPKARNQLKRIARMPYDQNLGDEFVRAWLLLADIYVKSGKYDMAQELCKRCLQFDRSCSKAWEYMGSIMEKEQSYKDAAEHYEQAWKYMNESNAPIGYKLAFNYLKARRFVEAIDVCHKVLATFPDYPKIRKDVLERARAGLRP